MKNLTKLMKNCEHKVIKLRTRKDSLKNDIQKYEAKIAKIEKEVNEIDEAIELLNGYAVTSGQSITGLFEKTVTLALQKMFDNSYEFKVEQKQRGNTNGCDFLTKNSECPTYLPLKMCKGKSVKSIISFVLQIMMVRLLSCRNIFCVDEPFEGLEEERFDLAADFIKYLREELQVQIVMVTHNMKLVAQADKVKVI